MHLDGNATRRALSAGSAAFLLLSCTTPEDILASYARPPESCEAIKWEMRSLASRVADLSTLEASRDAAMALLLLGVAVEVINPAFALAPPLIGVIDIDTERDEERLRFLANAKLHRGCE